LQAMTLGGHSLNVDSTQTAEYNLHLGCVTVSQALLNAEPSVLAA